MSLQTIAQAFLESGDDLHAAKLAELIDKKGHERLDIAFCGHFSAGKSSLINALCGANILPSSPIPTSANIVTIQAGEAQAYVKLRQAGNEPQASKAVAIDQLDDYCKRNDIESVDIHYPAPWLAPNVRWMDTPGADSTDDAHALATASAIHLADVVIYVLDYNHVQSETNFSFAKQLMEWGKPLLLVINQIDKHREEELSFESFRSGVEQAFHHWQIALEGVIYLSLKEPGHIYNEWSKLIAVIQSIYRHRAAYMAHSRRHAVLRLIEDHVEWLRQTEEPSMRKWQEMLEAPGSEEAAVRYGKISEQLVHLRSQRANLSAEWKQQLQKLLDNANLIPAQTREQAAHYLESKQPGFKTGFLFAGNKTAQEKERRLNRLVDNMREQVNTQITGHVISWLYGLVKAHGLDASRWDGPIAEWHTDVPEELFAESEHRGAVFGGAYVMAYSETLSRTIKMRIRQSVLVLLADMEEEAAGKIDCDILELTAQLSSSSEYMQAIQSLEAWEQSLKVRKNQCLSTCPELESAHAALPDVLAEADRRMREQGRDEAAWATWESKPGSAAGSPERNKRVLRTDAKETAVAVAIQAPSEARDRQNFLTNRMSAMRDEWDKLRHTTIDQLRHSSELIAHVPALSMVRSRMMESAERLRKQQFTLALFGAFSAGKSSFCNALIGQPVFPVSPNPTTAAINRLHAPDGDHAHGTVRVVMKTAEQLDEDLRYSMETLGLPWTTRKQAFMQIEQLHPSEIRPKGKSHYAFLTAVTRGWAECGGLLGNELAVTMDELHRFAALEQYACYVNIIDVYMDCPLTAAGIELVDTPGADSINARHTNVTFQYIQNADAVLFVTYYNHAFSRADETFLRQLGRVKDSFAMDKMFFILNASDLASSADELSGVVDHLTRQLARFEVRHPRIYPLSSRFGLQAKTEGNPEALSASGLDELERALFHFTDHELGGMAVQAAQHEMRKLLETLTAWERQSAADEQSRLAKVAVLQDQATAWLGTNNVEDGDRVRVLLSREVSELLYYVKQRYTYRFGEWFQYAFNPSTLKKDEPDIRRALKEAWLELLRMVSVELSQEMLAAQLRIQMWVQKRIDEYVLGMQLEAEKRLEQPLFVRTLALPKDAPVIHEQLFASDAEVKWLAGMFRSAKSFFEDSGREKMREALAEWLMPAVEHYVAEHEERFTSFFTERWATGLMQAKAQLAHDFNESVDALCSALAQPNLAFNPGFIIRQMEEMLED